MKITIVRHSIRNRGGDRLVLDYCSHFVQKGYEVTYWTNEVKTSFPIEPRIQIRMIPIKGILGTLFFSAFSKFEGDCVLVDLVIMAFVGSLRNKHKMIYLAQDFDVSYHKSFLIKSFTEFVYYLVLHRISILTIAVSDGLTKKLQKYYPKRLLTISNGVNLNIFYRDPQSSYIDQRQNPFVILLFARADYRKGLDIGIKVLERLRDVLGVPDWEVWVIGSEKVEIQGIKIKNLGFLDSDIKLREVFSAVDIYLVPSRSEGLSLLLLQALACECAIVSTEVSYIVKNEINGLISPIEDIEALSKNLQRVMVDDVLRSKLKINARLLAQEYSFHKSCTQFEQVLSGF